MDTFGAKLNTLLRDAAPVLQYQTCYSTLATVPILVPAQLVYSTRATVDKAGMSQYDNKILKEEVEKYKMFAERLEPFITDTVHFMNESILQKKKILVEGGQATMLDIDFGTYPFVTSSSPSAGGICTGLGISPRSLGDIIGVVRSVA